jgi:hypothetical protein
MSAMYTMYGEIIQGGSEFVIDDDDKFKMTMKHRDFGARYFFTRAFTRNKAKSSECTGASN